MVEMLVVIAGLLLLGMLLAPALCRQRVQARRSSCGGNCANVIKCCHLYSDAFSNLGSFPLFNESHNSNGEKAMAKLYFGYVKDHRVFSCPSNSTNTAVLRTYSAPDESTLQTGYSQYGYDPGHTPVDATAGVVGDYGKLHATNHKNSTNHGSDGPGQNVAIGAGSVEWWDAADVRPTKNANDSATVDDIYADNLHPVNFPEELETNIIK